MFEGTPLEVGVLFGFGGAPAKTQGQLAKEEFSAGVDHLMQAASLAAGTVGSAVGPRAHVVRGMVVPAAGRVRDVAASRLMSTMGAMSPLMQAARQGAREATEASLREKAQMRRGGMLRKRERKGEPMRQQRFGMAVGLLAAGVAAGGAAALVMRRRRRAVWEEYDSEHAIESMRESTSSTMEKTEDTADAAAARMNPTGKDASEEASALANDLTDAPINSKARRT